MAIVIGSPIGNLSGKLGGMVFARTAGRSTVRGFTKPTQPNSSAQLTARASFGSASQTYHSLSDVQKANWESYAKTIFNAKDQTNEGQWSGANAFTSLRNICNMAGARELTANYTDQSDVALAGDTVPIIATSNPPGEQLQANIATDTPGAPGTMNITDVTLKDDGEFDIELTFSNIPVTGLGQGALVDGVGNKFGFAVYVSEVISQEHNNVRNPSRQLLGIMPPVEADAIPNLTMTGLHIINDVDLGVSKYKSFGQVGDIVQLSLYSVSEEGMISCIGRKKVEIETA